jgi:Holliday junction DNA helicase RuvA
MIASIKGHIIRKSATEIIIDVNGIGYLLLVPLSTFYVLPEIGESVFLNVYTHVKEDALQLFGFNTVEEKKIFQLMISVSGIGPRLAINILSGIAAGDLSEAIADGNLTKLMNIPGIGRKMAERLVFELKTKVVKLTEERPIDLPDSASSSQAAADDALSALVNLGYKNNVAKQALEKAIKESPQGITLEEMLKKALKTLGT